MIKFKEKDTSNKSKRAHNTEETNKLEITELGKNLEIFNFSTPLQKKNKNTVRIFYNNCNRISINNMISSYYITNKKDVV